MDEDGRNAREVPKLRLGPSRSAAVAWHGGREVVAAGGREWAGIWLVDAISGTLKRLSHVEANWVLPLDDTRLVFAVKGHAYPPLGRAASIGVLDTGSGAVRWVIRDLQGGVSQPTLTESEPKVMFLLSLGPTGPGIWTLRLRDGKLRPVITEERVPSFAARPDGTAIYCVITEKPRHEHLLNEGAAIWKLTPGRRSQSW
jgi:hypothetical protein